MKKHYVLRFSLLVLLLVICVTAILMMRGFWREQASQELILAIKAKDSHRALEALYAHADPNVRDLGDLKPSLRGYLVSLWQQMLGIKMPHEAGSTALGLAVYQNNLIVVEALLARGAKNVNETLKEDDIAEHYIPLLIYATEQGKTAIVEALLRHGWNANTVDAYGNPALYYVRDAATVNILVAYGANINAQSQAPIGYTTLDEHLEWGRYPDVVDALLDAGAGDARAVTLSLHTGNKKALKRLAVLGWTVNRVDMDGSTPLIYALDKNRDLSVVMRLIQWGASVNVQNRRGESPLLLAATGYPEGYGDLFWQMAPQSPKVITALLERGAQVNMQESNGMSPLMVAASHLRPSLVQLLLKHGAQVNMRTKMGKTALNLARHSDVSMYQSGKQMQLEVVWLLRKAGARE